MEARAPLPCMLWLNEVASMEEHQMFHWTDLNLICLLRRLGRDILLIIAGSGVFKQVMEQSGVSLQLAELLRQLPIHPLVLGWMMAAIIRGLIGSATVAALTAASVLIPLVSETGVDPNLMVLAIGAGSLMFSHVNDSGFWMFKEYFNISLKDTLRSWSLMEIIVSVVGICGVMLLNQFVGA